jgi:hypothetical protein
MRAIVVREHGGPDNLLYEKGYNVPKELSEGEILVHNQYAGTSLHYSFFFCYCCFQLLLLIFSFADTLLYSFYLFFFWQTNKQTNEKYINQQNQS